MNRIRLATFATILLLQLVCVPKTEAAASLAECRATLDKFRQLGNVPEMMAES